MGTPVRNVYDTDEIKFERDLTSSFTAAGLTATSFLFCGAPNWTVTIPTALTGAVLGNLSVQANMNHPINDVGVSSGNTFYSINPLLNQPSMGKRSVRSVNMGFTGSWVEVAVLSAQSGYAMAAVQNIPVRWVRLVGPGLSASNFVAWLWTDNCTRGS